MQFPRQGCQVLCGIRLSPIELAADLVPECIGARAAGVNKGLA